jgi:hypothetical protein
VILVVVDKMIKQNKTNKIRKIKVNIKFLLTLSLVFIMFFLFINFASAIDTCNYAGHEFSCVSTSTCTQVGGRSIQGLCPGTSDIQCCVDDGPCTYEWSRDATCQTMPINNCPTWNQVGSNTDMTCTQDTNQFTCRKGLCLSKKATNWICCKAGSSSGTKYTLIVNKKNAVGVTIITYSPAGELVSLDNSQEKYKYSSGTLVTLDITQGTLDHWIVDGATKTDASITITMNADKTVDVYFKAGETSKEEKPLPQTTGCVSSGGFWWPAEDCKTNKTLPTGVTVWSDEQDAKKTQTEGKKSDNIVCCEEPKSTKLEDIETVKGKLAGTLAASAVPSITAALQKKAQATSLSKEEQRSFWDRWLCKSHKSGTKVISGLPECVFNWFSLLYGSVVSSALTKNTGSCAPEKPIMGSNNQSVCLSCNEDPYRICTKDRCQILGNCISVPTGKDGEYNCIAGKCEDLGLPVINKNDAGNISWYIDGDQAGSASFPTGTRTINVTKTGELPFNTDLIIINLSTDKPASCKYILDKINASFSEMSDFENNYWPMRSDGSGDWQQAQVMLPGNIVRNMEHRIFIKCKNACGVEPSSTYDINMVLFRLEKKPDQLPPEIVYVDPASNSVVRSDLTTVIASFWLDEKGSCKFSDKSINYTTYYNQTGSETPMVPFGEVTNSENSSVIDGGCYFKDTQPNRTMCLDRNETCSRCWLKLDLQKGYDEINYTSSEFNSTRMFHLLIRCNDFGRNNINNNGTLDDNVMTEDDILDYTIMTAPGYDISILKPEEGEKTFETQPEISVSSDPRITQCKYKTYNDTGPSSGQEPTWDQMTFIDDAFTTIHNGQHNETLEGSWPNGKQYTMYALCRDTWGLEARNKTTFYVLKDTAAPILIRTYHDTIIGDFLAVETDELSTCAYTYDTCNFNFSQGAMMTGTDEFVHAALWKEKTFFIKCRDIYDNLPRQNECTAILRPFEIPSLV